MSRSLSEWRRYPVRYLGEYIRGTPLNPDDVGASGVPVIVAQTLGKSSHALTHYKGRLRRLRPEASDRDVLLSLSPVAGVYLWQGPDAWIDQDIVRLRCRPEVLPSYYYWLATSLVRDMQSLQRFTWDAFIASDVLLPPLEEQDAIVQLLAREAAAVEAAIAEYEHLISLLEEKRVALIAHAITQGLDRDVSLKGSRVPWIGTIPAHWNVRQLRYCTAGIATGGTPAQADIALDDVPWYSPGDFGNYITLRKSDKYVAATSTSVRCFPKDTVLVVSIGAMVGRVGLSHDDCSCNQQCTALLPIQGQHPRYLALALAAAYDELQGRASVSTLPILSESKLKDVRVPVPPFNEQERIADLVDRSIGNDLTLIERIKEAIGLMRERHSALVRGMVTGHIDRTTSSSQIGLAI